MSLKPLCASPDDLKSYTFKEFKGGFFKAVKKLAKKHDTATTAAPFYLNIEQKYSDKPAEFFMVFGKLAKWKKHAKDNAMATQGLRGVCFVSYDETAKCLVLNLMPVAGKLKAKANLIEKAMKTVVSPGRCRVELASGDFSEEMLEQLEKATENMEDVPEDTTGNMMEDQVSAMHDTIEEAKAGGISPEQAQRLDEMAKDAELIENLLERMAASDNPKEVQALDKEIRGVFSKYVGTK